MQRCNGNIATPAHNNSLSKHFTGIFVCLSIATVWADVPVDADHFPDEGFRKWLSVTG